MAGSRHLVDSEPDVQTADGEAGTAVPTTVHFEAMPPRAATRVEQDARSVVISTQYDPADVTETIRPRAATRSTPARFIAWVEGHWVSLAVGVTVPLILLLGWSLLR